jgi:tetratricopeptide (TPR) repeat protein
MTTLTRSESSGIGTLTVPLWQLGLPDWLKHALACCVLLSSLLGPAAAQQPMPQMGAPSSDISNLPRSIDETMDRVRVRDMRKDQPAEQKAAPENENCLLPPLSGIHSPVISAAALAVPVKSKYEYFEACASLRKGKTDSAEKHLRKALQIYTQYPAAWVTLGQLLALENHTADAQGACFQASTIEPNFVPAYLCMAEIAAWGKAWSDVLQYSSRAIQLDPVTTPIPYEYNADANLKTNRLEEAERSALRAAEIDKDNKDPRVHFLLAQIYEAEGDRAGEITQLRLYLTFAKDLSNAAEIRKLLTELEQSAGSPAAPSQSSAEDAARELVKHEAPLTGRDPGNVGSGERKTDVAVDTLETKEEGAPGCDLQEVLPYAEKRVQEFVENVQKFTATQEMLFEALNGEGKVVRSERRTYDYTVSIGESSPAMLQVSEYQNSRSSSAAASPQIVTSGLPALLLIFHPLYAGDFTMRCEGSTLVKGQAAWQIRFRQRNDKPSRIRSYAVGTSGRAYPVDLEGRAWFATTTFQIVRLEADLARKIPEIQLTMDRTAAEYGPVHFKSRGIDIWLPQAVELTSERRGKRFRQRITFSNYLLFAIDNRQDISAPKAKPVLPLRFARLQQDSSNPWFCELTSTYCQDKGPD